MRGLSENRLWAYRISFGPILEKVKLLQSQNILDQINCVLIYGGKVTYNSIERLRPVTYNTTLSISFPQNVRLRPYPCSQAAGLKCGSLVRSQVTGYRSGRRLQVTGHTKTIGHWTKLFWTDVLLLLVFGVTPFQIFQNKNQKRSIDKVQNVGNERRYIYKDRRQESKFLRERFRNLVPGITAWDTESKTVLGSLKWATLREKNSSFLYVSWTTHI